MCPCRYWYRYYVNLLVILYARRLLGRVNCIVYNIIRVTLSRIMLVRTSSAQQRWYYYRPAARCLLSLADDDSLYTTYRSIVVGYTRLKLHYERMLP